MDEPVGFVSGLAKKGRIVSFWNKTFVIDKARHTVSTSAGQLQINSRDLSLVSPFLHQVVPYNGGLYLYFNRKLYYVFGSGCCSDFVLYLFYGNQSSDRFHDQALESALFQGSYEKAGLFYCSSTL